MEGVDFITSMGVGILVKAKSSLTNDGGDIAMINLQPQVRKVFEIIRLLPTLNVFADREELDGYLGKVQHRMIGDEEY